MFKALDKLGGHSMPSPGILLNMISPDRIGMATFQLGPSGMEEVNPARWTYVRIYRAELDQTTISSQQPHLLKKSEEEPCGVAYINLDKPYWVKIDGKWLSDNQEATKHGPKFLYQIVSKAEYETDLHFELWPEIRVSYRPIRQWFKRNSRKVRRYNMIAACMNVAVMFELLERADGPQDWMFAAAMALGIHVCSTVAELLVSMERGRK